MRRGHISFFVLIPDEPLDIQFHRWNLFPGSTRNFAKSHIDNLSQMSSRIEMSFNLFNRPGAFENLY